MHFAPYASNSFKTRLEDILKTEDEDEDVDQSSISVLKGGGCSSVNSLVPS